MNSFNVMRTDNLRICWDCAINTGLWCPIKQRATNAYSCDAYEYESNTIGTTSAGIIRGRP